MAEIKIVNELGPGKCFTDQGELYTVMDIQHNKTAMRQMIVKIKVKNLRSGVVKDLSFTGGDKVQMVYLDKRKMGYLYDDGTFCVFMDNETYEQVPINSDVLGDNFKFVKENTVCKILSYKGNVFGVEPPLFVELLITETDPGFKGDTATNATKPATLETGAEIKVPLFIEQGELIRIDTRTGEYMERA